LPLKLLENYFANQSEILTYWRYSITNV